MSKAVGVVIALGLLAAPSAATTSPATTVKVAATEFHFALSRSSAPLGTVRFVVVNKGTIGHDFAIDGKRTPLLQPGQSATLTVRLTKAGSFRYVCTVPGHAAAGMEGVFVAGKAKRPAVSTKPKAPTTTTLALTPLATGLGPLTDVAVAPTDPDRVFAVQQDGKVVMLDAGAQQVVADFGPDIRDDGENGLLAMTFSPGFATDHLVYFYYISPVGSGTDTLVSATMDADWTVDMKSVHVVLQVATPGANHRGGDIAFGPDGYLYVPIGDGDNGTYTTPGQYAQVPTSMLGGIVRVDPSTGAATIWAKGLRNPWRDYIDAATGLYYIGDVGENDQEEIDVVPLGDGGFDFGWPCVEGTEVHTDTPIQCPAASQLTAPVLSYPHQGRCAVIAGVVVHDPRLASLDGSFLYSDLCDGELRTFTYAGGQATDETDLGLHADQPTSFGEGPDGRVYLVTETGSVYRLDPS
jgi:glucose/arabinose dehydrogenase